MHKRFQIMILMTRKILNRLKSEWRTGITTVKKIKQMLAVKIVKLRKQTNLIKRRTKYEDKMIICKF